LQKQPWVEPDAAESAVGQLVPVGLLGLRQQAARSIESQLAVLAAVGSNGGMWQG